MEEEKRGSGAAAELSLPPLQNPADERQTGQKELNSSITVATDSSSLKSDA